MEKLFIADIRTSSPDGQMKGHYVAVARNYQQIFKDKFNVVVAGGPAFKNYFPKEDLLELPYNVPTTGVVDKLRTMANAIRLFRKGNGEIIVIQQCTVVTSFVAIALFYWCTSKLYLVQYNTEGLSKWFYRFLYFFARPKIDGIICPNERVGRRFGKPFCIVPDYIYPNNTESKSVSSKEKVYDVGILGSISKDKGTLEALKFFAGKPCKVLIAGGLAGDVSKQEVEDAVANASNIDLKLGFVDDKDYHRYISMCRYGVLNYRGTYFDRSSGVVLDWIFGNTPVIGRRCPALTCVEEYGIGELFDDINHIDVEQLCASNAYQSYLDNITAYKTNQSKFTDILSNFLHTGIQKRTPLILRRLLGIGGGKLLVFHPIIAPYRIDLFNALDDAYDAEICLYWRNLKDQAFDYAKIESQFSFRPTKIIREELGAAKWLKSLWQKISESQPDTILVSEFGLATIVAILHKVIKRDRYKIVSIVDDSYNMVAEGNQFSWRHKWATKLMMPFLENVINVEPRVTEYYQRHYGKGIYFSIICDDVKARQRLLSLLPKSEEIVGKYNLEGKKVLLFVGRLVALKNIGFAIRAYKRIANRQTAFIIVGDGEERQRLEKEAEGCDSIIFTGRKEGDELYAYYNVAQVFTLPSIQEPFGAVTNEALLGGCYALVSQLAGSNCLIEENVNGNRIDPYDEEGFAELLAAAFDKLPPCKVPLQLRDNNMEVTFKESIERLLCSL